MCGIIGSIGTKFQFAEDDLKCLNHRGPDYKNFFHEENVFLGHTRLAIQDLSEHGNQPMFSADGRYVIIYNGEVYNHWDIREDLNEYNFQSTSDTETILYGYIKWGTNIFEKLNGIFALCIYDRETKKAVIARDHFGVKPLYYFIDNDSLLFASEIKAFARFDFDKTIDAKAIVNYLSFLWSPGEQTSFQNVKKLLPGHFIELRCNELDKIKIKQFYKLQFKGIYLKESEEKIINLLEQKLLAAVKRQMLADVPVGFFLSGGLDSSLIVAMAKKLFPDNKFECFTIDVKGWGKNTEGFTDDLQYAKQVAQLLDVHLNIVEADFDILHEFDKMIWHLDEPQADAAPLNVLNIARLAREKNIKVLLGGTAGDDLFSGYRRHQAITYEKYFRFVPAAVGKIFKSIVNAISVNTVFFRRSKKIAAELDKNTEDRLAGYFRWLPLQTVYSLLHPQLRKEVIGYDPADYIKKCFKEVSIEKSQLNKMLYAEIRSFLVDHNLNYTDKMAMAVGVEARVPFLDVELVEFSTVIPPELKMKGKETKYILKKVAEKYLPKEIIYRPKTGFGAPVRKWLQHDLKPMIKERLSKENIERTGLFDANNVWQLIEKNEQGKVDASYSIFSMLAIESWHRQFVTTEKNYATKRTGQGILE